MKIILLPGLDGTGALFERLVADLPPSCESVVVSYPSDRARYKDLLEIVRTSLPLPEPFVIVAESFSGPLAILAAADKPVGLRGVVLAASFARSPVGRWISAIRPLIRGWMLRWMPWSVVATVLLGRGAAHGPLGPRLREAVSRVRPGVVAGRLREVLEVDVSERVGEVTVPILYLQAARDVLVRASSVGVIQQQARHFQIVTLDAPHLVLQVASRGAASVISQFTESVASREHRA